MTLKPGKVIRLDDIAPITYGSGEETRVLLRSEDTGGVYTFYEILMPGGGGSLSHIHEETDETFYVIEGEFEIKIDGEIHKAPAGTLVHGPRGVAHSFYNVLDTPSKMLATMSPGGIEEFFEELQELLAAGRPEWEQLRALGERHHIVAYEPLGGPHGGPPVAAPQ